MTNHGSSRHINRLAKSRAIPMPKKGAKWLIKASPGAHSKDESIPLQVLIRDVLHLAEDAREARRIIRTGEVLVDGKVRKKNDFAVGLMDVVVIPKAKKNYQIYRIGETLQPVEISDESAKKKSCRIVNKTVVKGNKVQLNLHDGKNILIEKEEDRFRVGDTIIVTIPKYEIDHFIKLEKGTPCYVFKGKHAGAVGILDDVMEMPRGTPADAKLKHEGEELITRKEYLLAVTKDFKVKEAK